MQKSTVALAAKHAAIDKSLKFNQTGDISQVQALSLTTVFRHE